MAKFKKGHIPWNKGKSGPKGENSSNWRGGMIIKICNMCSKEYRCKKAHIARSKYCSYVCLSKSFIGKRPWNYGKSEKSTQNELFRKSKDYKNWREKIFRRDGWTCVFCLKKGVILNADHIKPFAYFPELRLSIDNGRTLCQSCHRKTDTYGWGLYHKHNKYGK